MGNRRVDQHRRITSFQKRRRSVTGTVQVRCESSDEQNETMWSVETSPLGSCSPIDGGAGHHSRELGDACPNPIYAALPEVHLGEYRMQFPQFPRPLPPFPSDP